MVVEIVSPDSQSRDRGDKFYEYEEAGVLEYWILDQTRSAPSSTNSKKKEPTNLLNR